jgi:hypothetical protein
MEILWGIARSVRANSEDSEDWPEADPGCGTTSNLHIGKRERPYPKIGGPSRVPKKTYS